MRDGTDGDKYKPLPLARLPSEVQVHELRVGGIDEAFLGELVDGSGHVDGVPDDDGVGEQRQARGLFSLVHSGRRSIRSPAPARL